MDSMPREPALGINGLIDSNCGNLAMLAAIQPASSVVSTFADRVVISDPRGADRSRQKMLNILARPSEKIIDAQNLASSRE